MHTMNVNNPPHENENDHEEEEAAEEVYDVEGYEEQDGDSDQMDIEMEDDDNETEDHGDEDDDDEEEETNVNNIVFSMHKGSVFSCALSPSESIGASGGEDDKAFIFDTETGAVIFECKGHKDSVTNLSFSHNGTYLATGDMKGYLQVWKVSEQTKVWEFETNEINWIMWHCSSNILFAGTSIGEIWMWLIPNGNTKVYSHSKVSSECAVLTRDGKRLCSGFGDGTVKILDLKSFQILHSLQCHELQVTSLSVHQDNILLLSGSEDGKAKLITTHSGKEIALFNCELPNHMRGGIDEDEEYNHCVEVVSFCPSIANIAVTATLTGMITVWNVSSQTSRHHIIQGCGTSSIAWHPSEPYFASSGLDGKLRIYDARSAEQIYKVKGDGSGILSCHMNKDGSRIIMATDSGNVIILNVKHLWENK